VQVGDLVAFIHGKLSVWHRGLRELKSLNNLNLP